MTEIEPIAAAVMDEHGLTGLHLFVQPAASPHWRVFGFRAHAKGYQASIENGEGKTILGALANLSDRLHEGPIHRPPAVPI